MEKFRVGILGATGMVGQHFVSLLEKHPWFKITEVAASFRSAGKLYGEEIKNRWKPDTPVPRQTAGLILKDVRDIGEISSRVDFCFSALDMPAEEIRALEEAYAKNEIPVISNNSGHRWTKDVPMLIPEINPGHAAVISQQRKRLGTERGFIAVKPNCSIQSYLPVLAAWEEFGPYEVIVSTYQAVSGAGKTFREWPEMNGNIIPYISGEEEKSEKEPLKILGKLSEDGIISADHLLITSQCIRVPVLYGHTASVFLKMKKKPSKEELLQKLESFSRLPEKMHLPSAPVRFIHYMTEEDRPQAAADAGTENGMCISVGRLRRDSIFDWKFVGLSHNLMRGAAGGAVECAEFLTAAGYITKTDV